MQISLSEKEITAGVVAALQARGFVIDAATVAITYTQGRKANGLTATLDTDGVPATAAPAAGDGKVHLVDNQVPLVKTTEPEVKPQADKPAVKDPEPETPVTVEEPAPEAPVEDEAASGAEAPTTSLFQ